MELPSEVLIHNEQLGLKGHRGILIQINPAGFYELRCSFGDKLHRTLLPIARTVLIARSSEEANPIEPEIER